MTHNLGERVGATPLRRRLRFYEDGVRAAGVALIVSYYRLDHCVLAPPESLRCLAPAAKRVPTSALHAGLATLALQVNTSGRPIILTRGGNDRWVLAPLADLDRIRTELHLLKQAGNE